MGHLVNATAIRLGWTRLWTDNWITSKNAYCEYLYTCMRVRAWLTWMFFGYEMDKLAVFFSHIDLLITNRIFEVWIYVYIGILETCIQDVLDDANNMVWELWKEFKYSIKSDRWTAINARRRQRQYLRKLRRRNLRNLRFRNNISALSSEFNGILNQNKKRIY